MMMGGISDPLSRFDREMQLESLQMKRMEHRLHLETKRGARHKYQEDLAKKNLKHLTGTALHLGGKAIADVGEARSWIPSTKFTL